MLCCFTTGLQGLELIRASLHCCYGINSGFLFDELLSRFQKALFPIILQGEGLDRMSEREESRIGRIPTLQLI